MKHFVKNPALGFVSIPGVGPLKEGTILVGNDFGRYAPHFLTEVPEVPKGLPLESREPRTGPVLLTEPSPIQGAPKPEQLEEELQGEPVKRPRGRPRIIR
jgi:hypothetical protein